MTDIETLPPPPWLAVIPHLPGLLTPGVMDWLGDVERCIAWAWIDATWSPDND